MRIKAWGRGGGIGYTFRCLYKGSELPTCKGREIAEYSENMLI